MYEIGHRIGRSSGNSTWASWCCAYGEPRCSSIIVRWSFHIEVKHRVKTGRSGFEEKIKQFKETCLAYEIGRKSGRSRENYAWCCSHREPRCSSIRKVIFPYWSKTAVRTERTVVSLREKIKKFKKTADVAYCRKSGRSRGNFLDAGLMMNQMMFSINLLYWSKTGR